MFGYSTIVEIDLLTLGWVSANTNPLNVDSMQGRPTFNRIKQVSKCGEDATGSLT